MLEAFAAGLFAGSSLVVGAVVTLVRPPSERALGLIMAFGAGVLISAVAYELILEAAEISGGAGIPLGAAAGALAFFAGDRLIARAGGADRKAVGRTETVGSPQAIVLGTVLDGVPESIVIGLTLVSGGSLSVALFAAVFLSNLPEAMAATSGLAASGVRRGRIVAIWALIAVVCGVAAMAGYGVLGEASARTVAHVMAFAAGAVLTMLADTMVPEAFEHGGAEAGLATTFGFIVSIAIVELEGSI